MIGIDAEKLNQMIIKINSFISDMRSNEAKIQNAIEQLAVVFKNNDLINVSKNLSHISEGENKILQLLESYRDTLKEVRKSYMMQEQEVSTTLKNTSAKIER